MLMKLPFGPALPSSCSSAGRALQHALLRFEQFGLDLLGRRPSASRSAP
jgi:hypothetical protein